MTSNRNILIFIAVLLIGIFAVLAMNYTAAPAKNSLGGSIDEVIEEIGDEIDDNTTRR